MKIFNLLAVKHTEDEAKESVERLQKTYKFAYEYRKNADNRFQIGVMFESGEGVDQPTVDTMKKVAAEIHRQRPVPEMTIAGTGKVKPPNPNFARSESRETVSASPEPGMTGTVER